MAMMFLVLKTRSRTQARRTTRAEEAPLKSVSEAFVACPLQAAPNFRRLSLAEPQAHCQACRLSCMGLGHCRVRAELAQKKRVNTSISKDCPCRYLPEIKKNYLLYVSLLLSVNILPCSPRATLPIRQYINYEKSLFPGELITGGKLRTVTRATCLRRTRRGAGADGDPWQRLRAAPASVARPGAPAEVAVPQRSRRSESEKPGPASRPQPLSRVESASLNRAPLSTCGPELAGDCPEPAGGCPEPVGGVRSRAHTATGGCAEPIRREGGWGGLSGQC